MQIRRARRDDAADILDWRNDPETRRRSLNSEVVSEADHTRWFEGVLADERRVLLIGEIDGRKVGMVRLDRLDGGGFEVSINMNPQARGLGYGKALLELALSWKAGPYVAYVKEDNAASLRLFEGLGFRPEATEGGVRRYVRS